MRIKIKKLHPDAKMPVKKHKDDFCYDIYACSDAEEVKDDNGNVIPHVYRYHTGLAFEICEEEFKEINKADVLSIDIRPRSSIYKTGLVLSNCTGTVDSSYRGEVQMVFYHVIPSLPKYIKGDRIGQIKIGISTSMEFEWTDVLSDTDRGTGGYGSTGR